MGTRLFHAVVLAGAALGAASMAACSGADQDDLWQEPTGAATPELATTEVDAGTSNWQVPPNLTEPARPLPPVDLAVDAWPPTKM